ncbi:MAG: hypothetical protein VR68_14100 [Peptococcaceae bacterium BRH_c4a]|nr:MAG: hypothetical protein VR68_14100 [Peptococcaceae bacterium BRH_c4a]
MQAGLKSLCLPISDNAATLKRPRSDPGKTMGLHKNALVLQCFNALMRHILSLTKKNRIHPV